MIDVIVEFILELFLEEAWEKSKDNKISKWIRYPIMIILTLFFSIVFLVIFFLGLNLLRENILASLLIIGIDIFLVTGIVIKIIRGYLEEKAKVEKI